MNIRNGLAIIILTISSMARCWHVAIAGVRVDSVYISTIAGQNNFNGVTITSSAYLAAGSSLTLQGPYGYIVSQSSITGSTFFGNGSNLSGINSLGSNIIWSGTATFTSSFTVQSAGNQISLSTGIAINNLNISPAGVITFFPEFHNSSSTIVPAFETSALTLGTCIPGSTLTITTNGGNVEVIFTGALQGTNGDAFMNFLQDGQFLGGPFAAPMREVNYSTTFADNLRYLVNDLPAGAHSYCLSIYSDSGEVNLLNDATDENLFFVKELK